MSFRKSLFVVNHVDTVFLTTWSPKKARSSDCVYSELE